MSFYNQGDDIREAKTIGQKIFESRTIFLISPIETISMSEIVKQLFALDAISKEPIHLYISSPGGSVMDGFAILDVMEHIESPIYTYALGMVASMASIIFMYGQKRYVTPNSQIMLHQPLGGFSGQASDIEITANQILEIKRKINEMVSDRCNRSIKLVENETDRDMYLCAKKAIDYGIADELTTSIKKHNKGDGNE